MFSMKECSASDAFDVGVAGWRLRRWTTTSFGGSVRQKSKEVARLFRSAYVNDESPSAFAEEMMDVSARPSHIAIVTIVSFRVETSVSEKNDVSAADGVWAERPAANLFFFLSLLFGVTSESRLLSMLKGVLKIISSEPGHHYIQVTFKT